MFTKDDILARLQNGDSVDAIAQEMADALNEAKTVYAEEEKEKEKKLEKAAKEKAQKREDIEHIIFELCNYFGKYVPDSEDIIEVLSDMKDEDFDEVAGSLDAFVKTMQDLKNFEFKMPKFGFKRQNKALDEDPIFNFLTKKPWLM